MTLLVDQLKHPIDDIIDFVHPFFLRFTEDELRRVIHNHWLYGTIDAVYRDNQIIACARWNVSNSGIVVDVLDLFIKEGEDGVRLMKHLIARNWNRFPSVKVIRFARERKYPNRPSRLYSIHNSLLAVRCRCLT